MDQTVGLFPTTHEYGGIDLSPPPSAWLRPILMTACSADGTDIVQVDARRWFERAARGNPQHIQELCKCWFTLNTGDPGEEVITGILRTLDTDTSLFLVRRELTGTPWTVDFDRRAVSRWIMATQPDLRPFLDPLMTE